MNNLTSSTQVTDTKEIIHSWVSSGLPAEELLNNLDSYGIEWYVTEKGGLLLKLWQIGPESFVPKEQVAK